MPAATESDKTNLIRCGNPYLGLAKVAQFFAPSARQQIIKSIHPSAEISKLAQINAGVTIGANCVIGQDVTIGAGSRILSSVVIEEGVSIGENCLIHSSVSILRDCVVGNRSIIHTGAVIGADGFGFAVDENSARHKIPHLGIVVVGDDVEIGANTTIDRATFGQTVIGSGTKLDNLVQIAHNVKTGRNCVMAAQSGIAGSTTIGDRVVIGAQVGVIGHLTIGNDVTLAGRAGVTKSISKPGAYSGLPAKPHKEWLLESAALSRLPALRTELKHLTNALAKATENAKKNPKT